MKFLKIYIKAIKDSYSYMEGLRGIKFWVYLPFNAYRITYWTMRDQTAQGSNIRKNC